MSKLLTDCWLIEECFSPNISCCMSCLDDVKCDMYIHELWNQKIAPGLTLSLCCEHSAFVDASIDDKGWEILYKKAKENQSKLRYTIDE